MEKWYTIKNTEILDTPALVVYPNIVKKNIQEVIAMIGDVSRLRPHIKTHKSIEATQLMMAAGIHKFKCATIAEAEILGLAVAKDVLLAYQPVGPKLHRFIELIKAYPNTQYSCLVDNLDSAKEQSGAFLSHHLTINVYLDINLGFDRTGIIPNEKAFELYKSCTEMPGIRMVGMHAYDGHIHDTDFQERQEKCNEAFQKVEALSAKILRGGMPQPKIIAGGTPTYSIHCKRPDVECSPGTFIYWDKGYTDLCAEQNFNPAILLITRVISLPNTTKLCLDLGHKSVASENELSKRIFFLNAPDLKPIGHSEEHLIVEAGDNHGYKVGDILYGVPYHVCPSVALHDRAFTIDNQYVTGFWKTIARDRYIHF
jgi:D-threonine aldolase